MELMQIMNLRQSVRSFKADQIDKTALQTILKAAYASPVARAKFEDIIITVIQNQEMLKKIREVAAGSMDSPDANPTFSAPTLIIIAVKLSEDSEITPIACTNVGVVVENMHLTATDLGLGSVILFGFIRAMNLQNLLGPMINLPAGYAPVGGIGIGYAANALNAREIPDEKIKTSYII